MSVQKSGNVLNVPRIYKIEVGLKLDFKKLMSYIWFKLVKKCIFNNLGGKRFLKLF